MTSSHPVGTAPDDALLESAVVGPVPAHREATNSTVTPTAGCELADGTRHYVVTSPVYSAYDWYDTELGGGPMIDTCDFFEVAARTKREALRLAVASKEFDTWREDQRGDGRNPYAGVKIEQPLCEHGMCFGCHEDYTDCPECVVEIDERDRLEEAADIARWSVAETVGSVPDQTISETPTTTGDQK